MTSLVTSDLAIPEDFHAQAIAANVSISGAAKPGDSPKVNEDAGFASKSRSQASTTASAISGPAGALNIPDARTL